MDLLLEFWRHPVLLWIVVGGTILICGALILTIPGQLHRAHSLLQVTKIAALLFLLLILVKITMYVL